MANSDSFIDEVSEELRRDRLFALMRRWGWLAALVVVGIVGGAAWFEYQRAQDRAAAQAFGDALLASLDLPDPEARVAALDGIDAATPMAEMLLALMAAGEVAQGGQGAAAAADRLRTAAEAADVPRHYRDLALLRAEMMDPSDPATARLVLGTLAEPGAPFAALAEEQLALVDIRQGDLPAALDRLRGLERSAAATPGLQQRASQLIVALEAGSQLVDTAPEPVVPPQADAPETGDATGAETAPAPQDGAAPTGAEDDTGATTETETETEADAAEPAPAESN
ncbi:hypothetical protein [Roseicyclus marinus]|uniref:hypothetical protein n=1 Tax=Roseicyclus marinus TaxID=2161673 RepID=UPI00240FDB89|nr:hypothetical protein [Roseicyclus marinus]MDG3042745.1 hypothetical protein [Roseicyclus marinus]